MIAQWVMKLGENSVAKMDKLWVDYLVLQKVVWMGE
jgi:hypothetical protein